MKSVTANISISARDLETFARDIFIAAGLPADWAQAEAEILVWADLRGTGSHGVLRIPSYLAGMRSRRLRTPDANIHVALDKGCIAVIEADRGPGLYVTRMAMDMAIERARVHGMGAVWVRNGTHTGAMGYYAQRAAEAGMAGLTFSSSRPLMAYHGSREAALGTAPLSIAVPRANGEPIVFDMASSATTIGAMAQARQSGKALPEGVAVDSDGRATTDPYKAETPLPIAGAKGSGLGFMLECLASLLAGAPLLATALEDSALRADYLQNVLCIAIDPAGLDFGHDFAAEVDRLAQDIAALPPAEGFSHLLMPGERGARMAAQQARDGIVLTRAVWDDLLRVAARHGVKSPEASEAPPPSPPAWGAPTKSME